MSDREPRLLRRVRIATAALALLVIGIVAVRLVPAPVKPPEPRRPPYCAPAVEHGAAPSTKTEARGCRYDTGIYDQSPSIQVTRAGVLFVGRNAAGVLRSTDRGLNWQAITPPPHANGDSHAKGVHGYVHVDPVTDRVWYVTSNSAKSCGFMKGGAVVSWTDDLGKTWHGSTTGCGTYDWGRLVTGHDPSGVQGRSVYFFGVAPRLVGGLRPVYRSRDGGSTWVKLANPASVTTESGAGVVAPDGTLYFDYPEFIGFDPARATNATYPFVPGNLCRAMIAVSEDFGETWRQQPIPNSRACSSMTGQQRVAVDEAGTVYAVWNDDRDSQAYLVVSHDKARTWSKPVRVMPPGATFNNNNVNIVAGAPGHIVISSMNTTARANPRRWIVSGYGVWKSYLSESFDGASPSPRFRSVDLDGTGDPTLAVGESPSEAEAYLGMSPSGEAWATFSRHGGRLGRGSRIVAAHLSN
jgi:hypothetical protein